MTRKRHFGFVFWVAVSVCFCAYSTVCEEDGKSRQTYVIRYKDGEQTIPVTVVLDYKKQTEYVINMNPRTPAKSVTLYDFKQRTIAYKDLTNGECFLGRLTHETMNEENSALQDVKNPVEVKPKMRSLDPKMPALTPTEIRNIAGQKTAVFCRKMNTWLLVPEKFHSISKREADEYEERIYQHHGHRSSQYSHYERETRRRYRNRNPPNFRHRFQGKEGEAENENSRLGVPKPSQYLPPLTRQPSSRIPLDHDHTDTINHVAIQDHSSNYHVPRNLYSDQRNAFDDRENRRESFTNRMPFNALSVDQNLKYPSIEAKSYSSEEVPYYSKHIFNTSHDFNSNETRESLVLDPRDFTKESTPNHFVKNNPLEKLISEDSQNTNEQPTTTNSPFIPFGKVGYPNVHSSLVHLLPLYKPLGQEFDSDQETGTESSTNNHQPNLQSGIEKEDNVVPTAFIETDEKFSYLKKLQNVSHDSDSINTVKVPRITKEFEKIKDNDSYVPILESENFKQLHNVIGSDPLLTQKLSESLSQGTNLERKNADYIPLYPNIDKNNVVEETRTRKHDFHIPLTGVSSTTELPIFTTSGYSTAERTTLTSLYIPSVHTAFQNSEDFNTFQIFPNYIENVKLTEKNLSAIHVDSINGNDKIPQHLVLTTAYPSEAEKHGVLTNHRSDLPSEKSTEQSPLINQIVEDVQNKTYTSTPNNTIDVDISSYKVRYQSALRDFKPDEIVIDIENIPTHTPPQTTSTFHQRFFTTIQPTTNLSPNGIKNDTDQKSEPISRTTWRSLYPTTRYPRRRISDKSRRPVQNSSSLFIQTSSLSHNRLQAPKQLTQSGKLFGVNHFSTTHHTNRRQFHYPRRPVQPHHVVIPAETNQLHHISHLNNLPPGVSVHPRHPHAPFADMVHSNRPPTIPFVNDNQPFPKPHRQRHHRKKERHHNSCCRLRGQSDAFQSCCRSGGPCCSRSQRRIQPPGSHCCSSSSAIGQIIPAKKFQPPARITNQILQPIRTQKTHRSEMDNKDRCQKEKMCRTLYESTQQVMVCRNAHIEGC